MAFIRVKGRGNRRYAYLVSEKWTERGPRQKVSSYLGKVVKIDREKEVNFFDICDEKTLKEMDFKALVLKLVELELLRNGFKKEKVKTYTKELDGKIVNADIGKVSFFCKNSKANKSKEKDAVLQINEGFLCSKTIKQLIRIGSERDERDKAIGAVIDAGTAAQSKAEAENEEDFNEKIDGFTLARLVVNSGLNVEKEIFLKLYEKCINKELGLELPENF